MKWGYIVSSLSQAMGQCVSVVESIYVSVVIDEKIVHKMCCSSPPRCAKSDILLL